MESSHLGEIFSVLAAVVWAVSVVLFRLGGRAMGPLALNFFKNVVATLLVLATFPIVGQEILRDAPVLDYVLLALSGILGITVADTLFFRSLNIVGAGLSQVVSLAYSPFVILFTFVFLGERLSPGDIAGAAMILGGVLLTTWHAPPVGLTRKDLRVGVAVASLSVALMALGITIAKPVLDRSPVLWATGVRLYAGVVSLSIFTLASRRRRYVWSTLVPSAAWKFCLPAAVLGAYVAMVIWIAGMKFTQASTAAILNQTSAVFVLPIAAIVLKEPVTRRKLGAVALAIAGVTLVSLT
jgi:drug/metabolite transporter (DMT)-like permease